MPYGLWTPREKKNLHYTAENSIPIPNFLVQPKHILSATSAQFFRYLWFMPSLGVRSPWIRPNQQPAVSPNHYQTTYQNKHWTIRQQEDHSIDPYYYGTTILYQRLADFISAFDFPLNLRWKNERSSAILSEKQMIALFLNNYNSERNLAKSKSEIVYTKPAYH